MKKVTAASLMLLTSTAALIASDNLVAADASVKSKDLAEKCTIISARLKRLHCFDALFGEKNLSSSDLNKPILMPITWQKAVDSEAMRQHTKGFIVHYLDKQGSDPKKGVWMTLAAQSKRKNNLKFMPILMLSCIDEISRVEIILPKSSLDSKAKVTVNSAFSQTQYWFSDESGMVFRTGRGLLAIEVMKTLLSSSSSTFRSDIEQIQEVNFDLNSLGKDILPLRQACQW